MTKENILSEIEEIKESNRLNNQRIAALEAELKKREESELWEPEMGEKYYFVDDRDMKIGFYPWDGDTADCKRYNVGNCFPTEERANQVAEKIRMLLKLERYHDMFCPDYVPDWSNDAHKYYVFCNADKNKWNRDWMVKLKIPTGVYFDSEETARKVCDLLNREEDENDT